MALFAFTFLVLDISYGQNQIEAPKKTKFENEGLLLVGASGALLAAFAIDNEAQVWRGNSYSPFLDKYISPWGREYSVIGSLAFFGYAHIAKDRKAGEASVALGRALVFSYLGSNGLKMIFRRSRPNEIDYPENAWFQYDGPPVVTNSFPSGHATYVSSIATVLTLSYPDSDWVPWLAWGMAGAVGFERVYNGRHHPSDVIAGYILGYYIGKLAMKPWKIDAYFLPSSAGISFALD